MSMKEKKEVFVIFRVTKELKDKFYKKCKKGNVKPSDKGRELVEKFLK